MDGFCDEQTAVRIEEAILETDLIALIWPPGAVSECHQLPVSREGQRQNTWSGHPLDTGNIDDCYAAHLSQDAMAALHGAFQVCVIDPRWGRNDLLWPTLTAALPAMIENGPTDPRGSLPKTTL